MMTINKKHLFAGVLSSHSALVLAGDETQALTANPLAWSCIAIFVIAYCVVMAEERLRLRKSKPVILAAGVIWALISILAVQKGVSHAQLKQAVMHDLEEYAAMFLFLLVAMTYINAMEDRQIFAMLRSWLISKGFNYRALFWITGVMSFCISPVADNLTTALLMGAVIMAVGQGNPRFVTLAMINVVVAANAGGAFSPFGDITTLMVWQAGKVEFFEFYRLFLPSLVNYLVPAIIMSFFIDTGRPAEVKAKSYHSPGRPDDLRAFSGHYFFGGQLRESAWITAFFGHDDGACPADVFYLHSAHPRINQQSAVNRQTKAKG